MSTGKLDQSLDDILKTTRSSTRRGRGARRGAGRPTTTQAPVGGVHKATRQNKQNKAVPTAPAASGAGGESKIMISNLPPDVEESQLKEYFANAISVGKPKRIMMQYGPNGRSLGAATVIFNRRDQAAQAVKALDGIKIDSRLLKVELLVSAKDAPAATAGPSLAERVTQPKKDKPKPATATKDAGARGGRGGRGGRSGRGRGGVRNANPRGKSKTVEELDAEMEDYRNDVMVTDTAAPAAPTGGDTNMDDETL